ncbi:MAG: type IV pili methyl-accepting chemotaxis transducer N-terminal domain-containing protein [Rhodoferax sp.]
MVRQGRPWNLGVKLMLVGSPFLVLVFAAMVASMWVSWQLDGGAAAVNEAGRMRMQSYRLSLAVSTRHSEALPELRQTFNQSLQLLRQGDPQRPLFVAWDAPTRNSFSQVEQDWSHYQRRWLDQVAPSFEALRADTTAFVEHIDDFVSNIERHIAHWTAWLHLLQIVMLVVVLLGVTALLYTGYLFVLEPVSELKNAIERVQAGDFSARVGRLTRDEFGTLAEGFNGMAEHLQQLYRGLEARVAEKTAELQDKSARLASLYDITALVAGSTSLEGLAHAFVRRMADITRADAVALRWVHSDGQRHSLLATHRLPDALIAAENCIQTGECACGIAQEQAALRVIPIASIRPQDDRVPRCAQFGFATVVTVPVRLHARCMGELDLFFHAQITLGQAERSLIEALCTHLASGMENLRLNALEKEAAISHERQLLARELHDSIAQSLAFLKIQVGLMRDAIAHYDETEAARILDEIDVGVRESYGDVRELLLHFRTRVDHEDIEPALLTTLQKFEHQSGIKTHFSMQGHGLPLDPDVQIQVLHIVQEALSNVRKHANATAVWLEVTQQPQWRFTVRDDGCGFGVQAHDETHVGLRIMQERAQRIGALLQVQSEPGQGTTVCLSLTSATTFSVPLSV